MKDVVINKTIWIYWDKGVENAPDLIKLCIKSWFHYNKNWEIIILDDKNLSSYIEMSEIKIKNPNLTIQAFSDLLRIKLLEKYGGVWVDSTTYCNKPLDEWIYECAPDDVFFFKSNDVDIFGSWFIYAKKGQRLIQCLLKEEERYLSFSRGFHHYMNIRFFWRFFKYIEQHAGRKNYFIWRNYFVRSILGVSPYFWPNYLMGYLVNSKRECKNIYKKINYLSVNRPHDFQIYGLSSEALPEWVLNDFRDKFVPVYKMSYKRNLNFWKNNGTFSLLEKNLK